MSELHPPDPDLNPCQQSDGSFDHDWEWVSDSFDYDGFGGGTQDISYWRCTVCGIEDTEREPPQYEWDDDVV